MEPGKRERHSINNFLYLMFYFIGQACIHDARKTFAKDLIINAVKQDIDQHQSTDNSEESIALISEAQLPTEFGLFKSLVFQNSSTNESHVVLLMDSEKSNKPIVRFHSECLTGDVFGSVRCDCKAQLNNALATPLPCTSIPK